MSDTIYKQEIKVTKEFLSDTIASKDVIEKDVIIKFLKKLHLEALKEIVDFDEIDYENKKLWDDSRENEYLFHRLNELRDQRCVMYIVKL